MASANATAALPPMPPLGTALLEVLYEPTFGLRCAISGAIAGVLYVVFAGTIHHFFYREVKRKVFDWRPSSDFMLGLISLVFGSPILQAAGLLHEKYGIMKTYTDIGEYGWAWWALSIPVYLLLWDLVFYVLHLILHIEPIYSLSHANHHAFRPPVAWSGIAIDPLENIFSGLAPYLVPLFVLPFHIYTVYTINIILVGWATLLHSSCPWKGNWLFQGPVSHNLHHSAGKLNSNYGAIFKIWDRLFGTLAPEDKMPIWMEQEAKARAEAAAAAAGGKKRN